eukprot:scaffold310879_cov13-Prasinocladus_malaysianus.AAC.1
MKAVLLDMARMRQQGLKRAQAFSNPRKNNNSSINQQTIATSLPPPDMSAQTPAFTDSEAYARPVDGLV